MSPSRPLSPSPPVPLPFLPLPLNALTAAELEAQQRTKWVKAYMSGYASVVFFDDRKSLGEWYEKMPDRKDALAIWSKNGQGILQHTIWTALATEGLGANLQHFTQTVPGADTALRSVIDVPPEWLVSYGGSYMGWTGDGEPVVGSCRTIAPHLSVCVTSTRLHQCTAIMPFGEIVQHPDEKQKLPMTERLKVFID